MLIGPEEFTGDAAVVMLDRCKSRRWCVQKAKRPNTDTIFVNIRIGSLGTEHLHCPLGPSKSKFLLNSASPTGHLNRGIDGVFETVGVVSCSLVSIAKVHAIVARAHLAQGEPEMARDRFGFLEHHGFVKVALTPAGDLFDCARDLFDEAKPKGRAKLY
jgi:hypothetical protein